MFELWNFLELKKPSNLISEINGNHDTDIRCQLSNLKLNFVKFDAWHGQLETRRKDVINACILNTGLKQQFLKYYGIFWKGLLDF